MAQPATRGVIRRAHLIELMIVVAIVGILEAFAIPSFSRYQLRSKSAEARVNLMAIATAQEADSAGPCDLSSGRMTF